ncbi:uncharacterized protein [Halyomorpha halys]|uniref:uncharacterized protein n=1 Tax=Halyomorpha halys TaxID=286706 RepID=UPI0006D503BB|nr:uncharacterized protein LOC106684494 isoform X1 [Halyomorpha halys]
MSGKSLASLHGTAMTAEFAKEHLKVCVAKMCKRIGWDSITQTALLVLVDLLVVHIRRIITTASKYSMCYEASNLDVSHVCLALAELNIPCAYTNPGGREFKFLHAEGQFETARLDLETRKFKPGFVEVHKWHKKCKKFLKRETKRLRKQRRVEREKVEYVEDHSENEPPKDEPSDEMGLLHASVRGSH